MISWDISQDNYFSVHETIHPDLQKILFQQLCPGEQATNVAKNWISKVESHTQTTRGLKKKKDTSFLLI